MKTHGSDYDTPWKEALDRYFREFITFFFPGVDAAIDWERGYHFLDKELQSVSYGAVVGRRLADKLVKVWLKNGEEAWVLAHIEVQGQEEKNFTQRMFIYHYRLYDRYERQVISMAVLTDEQPEWRPDTFGYEICGCRIEVKFPVIKLLDYRQDWDWLESSESPFATVVMTHLIAQETRHDPQARQDWKFRLTRRLYERGFSRKDITYLYRLIDWFMTLPQDYEERFWQELQQYERSKKMPYVTSVERIGIRKGIEQGIEQGLIQGTRASIVEALESRFEDVPESIALRLNGIEDIPLLKQLFRLSLRVGSPEEFLEQLPQ